VLLNRTNYAGVFDFLKVGVVAEFVDEDHGVLVFLA
jgi:hypothetical protein